MADFVAALVVSGDFFFACKLHFFMIHANMIDDTTEELQIKQKTD